MNMGNRRPQGAETAAMAAAPSCSIYSVFQSFICRMKNSCCIHKGAPGSRHLGPFDCWPQSVAQLPVLRSHGGHLREL